MWENLACQRRRAREVLQRVTEGFAIVTEGFAIVTGCRISVDSSVNEDLSQIRVIITGKHNVIHISFYNVP